LDEDTRRIKENGEPENSDAQKKNPGSEGDQIRGVGGIEGNCWADKLFSDKLFAR
jgi:hypothetical protein